MSECVVRMEMPQGCWCCPFGHYDWIWGDDGREKMVCFCCLDLESEEDGHYLLETELKRPSWCPIVCQLPEGHGRLVDADALVNQWATVPDKLAAGAGENKWVADMVMGIQGHFLEGIIKSLEEAPTIVPEERRANDGTD